MKREPISKVETVFRARVDWETLTFEQSERVANVAAALGADVFTGCGACGPYAMFEGPDRATVVALVTQLERYIRRFRGARILD